MKHFKAIAAISENRVIGAGNRIPWHLPEDFKWFKQVTMGHVLVMGRRTFESIGKPLPGRETLVLSRSGFVHPGVRTVRSLGEIGRVLREREEVSREVGRVTPSPPSDGGEGRGEEERHEAGASSDERGPLSPALSPGGGEGERRAREVFICGGADVYAQALPLCSDLYLTVVKRVVDGDAFFPPFEESFTLAEVLRENAEFKILHYRNLAPSSR